jgi:hypothetical protein
VQLWALFCLESEGGVTFHSQFMSQIDILMTHHSSLGNAMSAGLNFPAFNPVHVPMTYTPPSAAVAAASANALDKAVEKIHNVAFIASNCGWWRDVIVAGVMQHLEVNSMGNCLQNAPSIPSASYSLPGSAKTQVATSDPTTRCIVLIRAILHSLRH